MKGYERDPRVTLVQPICSRRVTYKLLPSTLSGELLRKSKDRLCSFPVYIIPGLGTIGKNLTPSALHPPVSYLWTLMTSFSPYLLQAEQAQLPQFLFIGEMPQSFCHLSGPSLDTIQQFHLSLVLGTTELDPTLQMWPH